MILYHGSSVAVPEPRIIASEYGRDFGVGFYTTTILAQAERWAKRRALIDNRRNPSAAPTVSVYEYRDEDAARELSTKDFPDPDLEWLDFVLRCRSDASFRHDYDIVTGDIANDDVGETISYVQNGIMRREDAVEKLKFSKTNDQICFNTAKALTYLKFIEARTV